MRKTPPSSLPLVKRKSAAMDYFILCYQMVKPLGTQKTQQRAQEPYRRVRRLKMVAKLENHYDALNEKPPVLLGLMPERELLELQ